MKLTRILIAAVCSAIPFMTMAAEESSKFELGVGVVVSPDYNDSLEEAYPDRDVSGGWGWLDLHAGLKLNLAESLAVRPGVDLWFNMVDDSSDVFVNTVLLPGVSLRYDFTSVPTLFAEAGLNYGLPNSGGDRLEFDSGGLGYSIGLGYTFESDVDLTLSYLDVPADTVVGEKNLGGFMFGVNIRL